MSSQILNSFANRCVEAAAAGALASQALTYIPVLGASIPTAGCILVGGAFLCVVDLTRHLFFMDALRDGDQNIRQDQLGALFITGIMGGNVDAVGNALKVANAMEKADSALHRVLGLLAGTCAAVGVAMLAGYMFTIGTLVTTCSFTFVTQAMWKGAHQYMAKVEQPKDTEGAQRA